MAKKRSFGLSLSQQATDFTDRFASSQNISRSEAIEQLLWKGLQNMSELSRIQQEVSATMELNSSLIKKEFNRLAKLQIEVLKVSAIAKGYSAFHLSNTLHIDEATAKQIEQKAIQKVLERFRHEQE